MNKAPTLLSLVSRKTIREAMDVYDEGRETDAAGNDQYSESGEYAETFSNKRPRYWVRSPGRPEQIYPSRPLIVFLAVRAGKKPSCVNAGWGNCPSDAARILHNEGFLIVDKENIPEPPPADADYLDMGPERIRLYALNYFIDPARERGEAEVSIRAGALASDLFLGDRVDDICRALKDEKLQELARAPLPTRGGPDSSAMTSFTFKLRGTG